jgi:endonuclease I
MKAIFKVILITVTLLFFTANLHSQIITNQQEINFPQLITGSKDSLQIIIKNNYEEELEVSGIVNFNTSFSISDSSFNISPSDSGIFWIFYTPTQNVIDNDLLIFESPDSTKLFSVRLTGSAIFNDSYDATTFNLYDNELKSVLKNLVINHTSLGYNTARDRMFDTLDQQPGDTIECVYTGRKIKANNRTEAQNQNFDTEHSWPQSTFNQDEPMRSDLNHLYPTDKNANNTRGNYPFGKVVSGITWQLGGSKLGKDSVNQTVFEPRDVHKGDVSRAMLYFIIRYENFGNYLDIRQENIFRIWNDFDEVSLKEINRNNLIAFYQNKRNPFIDHSVFVERIYSFRTNENRPQNPLLLALPLKMQFDTVRVGNMQSLFFQLLNVGNKSLNIQNIVSSDSAFTIGNYQTQILPMHLAYIDLTFYPESAGYYSGSITINSDGGNKIIPFRGYAVDSTTINEHQQNSEYSFNLFQNYPNPFNPSTKIKFIIPQSSYVSLDIYDVLGNKVQSLLNNFMPGGEYEIVWSANDLCSGIYICKLRLNESEMIRKMMLIK